MKKLLFLTALGFWTAAPALGAKATFDPATRVVAQGDSVGFDVSVDLEQSLLTAYTGVDLLVGWDQAGDVTFEYSRQFRDAMNLAVLDPPMYDRGHYTNDAQIGGASSSPLDHVLLVGRVVLHTTGMAPGEYEVRIDANRDGGISQLSFGSEREPVFGRGTVQITAGPVDDGSGEPDKPPADGGVPPDDQPGDTGGGSAGDDTGTSDTPDGQDGTDDGAGGAGSDTGDGSSGDDDGSDGGAGDAANANSDDPTADSGPSGSNANGSPSQSGSTARRGACGFGIVGVLPLCVTGALLLHAPRRRRGPA